MGNSHTVIEFGAALIEGIAVALIAGTFLWATIRFIAHTGRHRSDAYDRYKVMLGKALSLGLEFLVAADVIRTVTMQPTLTNIEILGAIIFARTFLSWSLLVEIEGHWPWERVPGERAGAQI